MILKRSTIKNTLVLPALILTVGMTACTADDSEPAPKKSIKPTDGIALTIPLSSTRTGDDTSDLMDRMCIATYDEKGHYIETIWNNNGFVKDKSGIDTFDKIGDKNGYGTVMSVMLPMTTYEEYTSREIGEHYGIKFVAFYLPEEGTKFQTTQDGEEGFVLPATLDDLNKEIKEYYTLNFPTTDGSVWQPTDDMQIPMSGVLDITEAAVNYDPAIWDIHHPMFLTEDPLVLIRSMAKVTIVNGDKATTGEFLTGAKFKTAGAGSLLPEIDKIYFDQTDNNTKVNSVSLPVDFKEHWQEDNKASSEYVFYTFERDLSGQNAKGLLDLEWKGHDWKKFDFVPTNEADKLKDEWKGILRNHSYTFTVIKPANEDVKIEVSVDEWEAFDFNEKI